METDFAESQPLDSVFVVKKMRNEEYFIDTEAQKQFLKTAPWKSNVSYFKHCSISAAALMKMVKHARSGGSLEIMGVLRGKVEEHKFVVYDAIPLPVEGTETRVNAQSEAFEYLTEYMETTLQCGFRGNMIGWYHSHPGYGCWLSGVDVQTQCLQQTFQDPFVAVVIDPLRTLISNKVDIGAFRTFPEGYEPVNNNAAGSSSSGGAVGNNDVAPCPLNMSVQPVSLEKLLDYGCHANRYYALEISYFKSDYDQDVLRLLWSKNWYQTLSSSGNLSQKSYLQSQLNALGKVIEKTLDGKKSDTDRSLQLEDCRKHAKKIVVDQLQGLINQLNKVSIFGNAP